MIFHGTVTCTSIRLPRWLVCRIVNDSSVLLNHVSKGARINCIYVIVPACCWNPYCTSYLSRSTSDGKANPFDLSNLNYITLDFRKLKIYAEYKHYSTNLIYIVLLGKKSNISLQDAL